MTKSAVRVSPSPTFEKFADNIETFALKKALPLIRKQAEEIGADRVFVAKNLTNNTRPVSVRFMLKSRFVRNSSLNAILGS